MPGANLIFWGWKSGASWPRGDVTGTMDELIIYFQDATGKISHTFIHIDSAATALQIKALVDALQAASDASVIMSERKVTTINASATPAVAYNPVTAPYSQNTYRISFTWDANVDGPKAYNSMFSPIASNMTQDSGGNIILDTTKTPVINIINAAKVVMRNNINSLVTGLNQGLLRIPR